ncbi:unnamed protein product [Paramecium sonneborni]|uniref:Uncharacterized protein n=1 Tax=Paramecium sonneborni TaxID=65129 RepID=A0A8S1RLR0_9CILI|nr:unnamed protein product [Paramecium sonneborni]
MDIQEPLYSLPLIYVKIFCGKPSLQSIIKLNLNHNRKELLLNSFMDYSSQMVKSLPFNQPS